MLAVRRLFDYKDLPAYREARPGVSMGCRHYCGKTVDKSAHFFSVAACVIVAVVSTSVVVRFFGMKNIILEIFALIRINICISFLDNTIASLGTELWISC
jgi:hypothetical protein